MLNAAMFLSGSGILDIKEALFPNLPNFIAHVISTIIMVIFLAKMVYKPFKQFNKNQADEINKLLNEAAEKQTMANKSNAEAQLILDEAKSKTQEMMLKATAAVDQYRNTEVDKVKAEIAVLHENAEKSISMEREKLQQDIEKEIIQVAFDASRKIIGDKITKKENEKLVKDFIKNLG